MLMPVGSSFRCSEKQGHNALCFEARQRHDSGSPETAFEGQTHQLWLDFFSHGKPKKEVFSTHFS